MSPPDTRRRILETAFRLFYEQGYHATGVATILRESGVNSGSLYHFFQSKDDLLLGVLRYALEELRPQVMGPAEAMTADPVGRVFALMGLYRHGLELTKCKMGCPIGNLALEVSDDHPPARELIHANFEQWVDFVESWLKAAGDRLPADTDRRALARFVLTTMEGGIMQARAADDLAFFDQAVAQLRTYFDLLQAKARAGRASAGAPRPRRIRTR